MNIREYLIEGMDDRLVSILEGDNLNNDKLSNFYLQDYQNYCNKNDYYKNRLIAERKAFNKAIDDSLATYNDDVKKKKDRQDKTKKESASTLVISILFLIMVLVNLLLVFVLIPNDSSSWFESNILFSTSFDNFYGGVEGASDVPQIISIIIACIAGLLGLGFGASWGSIFIILIGYFIIRIIIALLSYLVLFLLEPIGLIIIAALFILFMVLKGRNMELPKYVFRFWFNIICTIIITVFLYIVADKIGSGSTVIEALNYVLPFLNLK